MFEWFTDLLNSFVAWVVSILVSMGIMEDSKSPQNGAQPQPQKLSNNPEIQSSD